MTKKSEDISKTEELKPPAKGKELSERHEAFIKEYLLHYNGVKAYMKYYPDSTYDAARMSASRLLAHDNIIARIDELRQDLEKAAGVTKLRVLKEFMAIGFSSFTNLLDGWMDKKEFEDLSEEELACIKEIKHEIIQIDKTVTKEVVKFTLHDKQRALENIIRLFGYADQQEDNTPVNIQVNIINPNK